MAMRDYMKDLMRAQKASEVRIVHDASISALPEEDDALFGNSIEGTMPLQSSLHSTQDDSSYEDSTIYSNEDNSTITSPGNSVLLGGFRERHRKLKETLSPRTVYRWSPSKAASLSQTTPSSVSSKQRETRSRRDNQRSRLIRLASDSNIIDGPPEAPGFGWWKL